MLQRIQHVTPTDWGSLLPILHTPVTCPAEPVSKGGPCEQNYLANLPRCSWTLPGAEHQVRVPSSLLTNQSLFTAEPERGPLCPVVPSSFQCSQVFQKAERSGKECDGSGRESGWLGADNRSGGIQALFRHLILLVLRKTSLLDHRCLWPPVTHVEDSGKDGPHCPCYNTAGLEASMPGLSPPQLPLPVDSKAGVTPAMPHSGADSIRDPLHM